MKALPAESCPAPSTQVSSEDSSHEQTAEGPSTHAKPTVGSASIFNQIPSSHQKPDDEYEDENEEIEIHTVPTNQHFSSTTSPPKQQNADDSQQHHVNQHQITSDSNSNEIKLPQKPNESHNEMSVGSISSKPGDSQSIQNSQAAIQRPNHQETLKPPAPSSADTADQSSGASRENAVPTNTGFLNGLTISPISSHNQALAKLNQSSQNVNENDMAHALESTVPNLVSNIFSNIKNLTMQTEQNPDRPQLTTLTSIDGSSVDIKGDNKDQITADGEKLFDIWLEHQIETLNLTATMANHIRKSAGVLFRRIIKQYVERVERMGGKVEQNIQRATQMALNNTQLLIAFLLKNYVNFAAGIMQILGEQVSRVGKQLDSTGETIAHMSLNPFDIISSVMESLPNPSEYSNYFRNIGKQLLGDLGYSSNSASSSSSTNAESNSARPQQNSGGSGFQPSSQQNSQGGLITKTIGAITKFGSWLG